MNRRRIRPLAGLVAALLISVALAACGGSSSTKTTTAASAASPPAVSATGSSGSRSARSTALIACLKKAGVTLPTGGFGRGIRRGATGASGRVGRFGSSGPFGASGRFGAAGRFGATGPSSPARGGFAGGATFSRNPKLAAAIAKCGGFGAGFGAGRGAGATGTVTGQYRTEVKRYAACMKSHGVTLPTPNFGTGSVFGNTVNTTTAAFKSANASCEGLISRQPTTPSA